MCVSTDQTVIWSSVTFYGKGKGKYVRQQAETPAQQFCEILYAI